MWIKRLLAALPFKRAAQVVIVPESHKPERKLCVELLQQLNVQQFALYQSSVGMEATVVPHFPNIEDYTTTLKEITKAIKAGRHILTERIKPSEARLTVDRFLVSNDGFYLDVEKAVGRFKEAALGLCTAMEPSDTEDSGYYEHHLRVLTKLFINLRQTTSGLIEVSLHN